MNFKTFSLSFFFLIPLVFSAQDKPLTDSPRLVVGIVVDQMRYDFLTRFWDHYGDGGFKKMVNEGFVARNHHYDYYQTKTGPGHASVSTGCPPAVHGIIGNDWFDKNKETMVYCVDDSTVKPLGVSNASGQKSPSKMLVTTLADQNRLATQFRGKTISISIKDRAAVLSGGHTANAAYWFYGKDKGHWISSSHYMDALPPWVQQYNQSNYHKKYFKDWNTLKPIDTYKESGTDQNHYEGGFLGQSKPVFPHPLKKYKDSLNFFDLIKTTPYGNSLTLDFALMALKEEKLGLDEDTDFLAISFSSTDYIGHTFGVNSKEVQDTYVRLDRDIEQLLKSLDEEVGAGQYSVFLTSDHGAVHVPNFLKDHKIPAGYINSSSIKRALMNWAEENYGSQALIQNVSNNQVFLNRKMTEQLGLNINELQDAAAEILRQIQGIDRVYVAHQIEMLSESPITTRLVNGFHQKRSGDVLFVYEPSFVSYGPTGSTHGTGFVYDTHAPLLLFGKGVKVGHTFRHTKISDIAPTMAAIMGITAPNGSVGTVIYESID